MFLTYSAQNRLNPVIYLPSVKSDPHGQGALKTGRIAAAADWVRGEGSTVGRTGKRAMRRKCVISFHGKSERPKLVQRRKCDAHLGAKGKCWVLPLLLFFSPLLLALNSETRK